MRMKKMEYFKLTKVARMGSGLFGSGHTMARCVVFYIPNATKTIVRQYLKECKKNNLWRN